MSQFTQLGLSGKQEQKAEKKNVVTEKHSHSIANQTVGVFAGALIFTGLIGGLLLETSGCSRTENKADIQAPPVQSVQTVPVQATAAVPTALDVKPAVKKVVKKAKPTTTLYSDQASGVSFLYPKKYGLKVVDKTMQDAALPPWDMNFVQPGGLALAMVELPKKSYPGTDLATASFTVSVNKSLTEEQCKQFTLLQLASSDDLALQPSKVKLGGMEMHEMEAISGSGEKQADAKYYHRYENGTCYEFAVGLSTQAGNSDDEIVPVDRENVFRRLERILATVKITPVAAATGEVAATRPATETPAVESPVASTPQATPATQDVAVK